METERNDVAVLKTREGTLRVPLARIVYLEGTGRRRVLVHLVGEDAPIEAMGALGDLAEALADYGVLRVQKSFAVNLAHLLRISNYTAVLDNGLCLRVSERDYRDKQDALARYRAARRPRSAP